MSNVFLYPVDLPDGINEMVSPGWEDDYTIYVNSKLPYDKQIIAVDHAIRHLRREDFYKSDVQQIEADAHRKGLSNENSSRNV